ncbi:MAG: 2,4-dihydroxyhept-2-ene-1,7-dioic acid aldolase [Proteobacteria bacterium]|nr:2,4-dihydroxyhept-2-ene-1,7-dioic acid aldolase [Pseudomonadota bacterium]
MSAWRADEQTVGCWLSLANAYSAEAMAHLGFDWVCVDLQHGLIDYTDLTKMLPAISTSNATPIVRVPWNEPYEIMKVLDAGAYGVIVPMINNREEAEQAVMSCRYPPDGFRSFGPIRGALYGGRGYAVEANNQIACIAMIETAEGREKAEEIITTPGLDGVYIGPADLALSMGLPAMGDQPQPEHLEEVKRLIGLCKKHDVAVGIHTGGIEYTQKYWALGCNFVTLGSDAGHIAKNAAKELAAVRGNQEKQRESTGY